MVHVDYACGLYCHLGDGYLRRQIARGDGESRNLAVFIVPDIYEILLAQARLGQLDGIPVFRVDGFVAVPSGAWKRALDVVLVISLGIIAVPLILLAAVAIKIESPGGPVFYRQQRVGQGGRVFQLIKLRIMVPDAEKLTGPVLATDRDPRITLVGCVLRATRIDELPQLWNVLKGEMSFIGPRAMALAAMRWPRSCFIFIALFDHALLPVHLIASLNRPG